MLYDASNVYAGVINFMKTTTLPPTKEASGYKIYLQHSTYFRDFVDLLRHETPLYLLDGDVLGTSRRSQSGKGNSGLLCGYVRQRNHGTGNLLTEP